MQSHPLHLLFGLAKCWRGLGWDVSWSQITMYFFDYPCHWFPKAVVRTSTRWLQNRLFHVVSWFGNGDDWSFCEEMIVRCALGNHGATARAVIREGHHGPSKDIQGVGDGKFVLRCWGVASYGEVEQLWIVGCPPWEWRTSRGGDPQEMCCRTTGRFNGVSKKTYDFIGLDLGWL